MSEQPTNLGNPLLSWDDLRILESIARDETKSMEERREACRRLEGQISMREGLSSAQMFGELSRVNRGLAGLVEVMRQADESMALLSQQHIDSLTPLQKALVSALVNSGVPVLDAIRQVADPEPGGSHP